MLEDLNAWARMGAEYLIPFGLTDKDWVEALTLCYDGLCENKYKSGRLLCPLELDEVGGVLFSYITYFSMPENKDKRYYYDELSDRKDPYRTGLVGLISEGAREYNKNITPDFTNDVLSYLYWAMKKNKCGKSVLRPKEVAKFKEKHWYLSEPYKSVAGLNDKIYNAMIKIFRTAEKVVDKAIDTANKVVDVSFEIANTTLDAAQVTVSGTLWAIRNLPYILTGGVVLFAGVQIYGKSRNGRFYGEATARNVIKAKTGLDDA